MNAVNRADLDALVSRHDKPTACISCRNHPREPVRPEYEMGSGHLVLFCAVCDLEVMRVQVAARQKALATK